MSVCCDPFPGHHGAGVPESKRRGASGRALVVVVALFFLVAGASACSSSPTTEETTSTAPLYPPASTGLLQLADLPGEWVAVPLPVGTAPCNDLPTVVSLVGSGGHAVAYLNATTRAVLVEYVNHPANPVTAYVAAVQRLENDSHCSTKVGGKVTTSTFEEVTAVPAVGDARVGMVLRQQDGALRGSFVYAVVRQGARILVVGYGGLANPDPAALATYLVKAASSPA
jgi:hypothetical protein